MAQPALPQPDRVLSLSMSNTQRNQIMIAAIQMKIQKLQSRTSQKLLMLLVPMVLSAFQVVVLMVSVVRVAPLLGEARRCGAVCQCEAIWSMQTVIASTRASFCPGATSTP